MQKKLMILFSFVLLLMVTGCGQATEEDVETGDENVQMEVTELPQFMDVQDNERVVVMHTNKGEVTLKLFPDYAPKAVENFITHSENGYYDGLTFHRVIQGFMIQGGDPVGNGTGGESIYGQPFEDEFTPKLAHFSGALAMANSGPNTNGSQFYIVHRSVITQDELLALEEDGISELVIEKYKEYGGTPWLDFNHETDFRHTVFGQVIEGMDVVNEIATVQVDPNHMPLEEVIIEKIEIVN